MESDSSTKYDDGSASKRNSRKRSARSTNQGPNRSVVDYDTEDQLREAMTSFINYSNSNSCSAQLSPLLGEIYEGQPVQKVLRSEALQTEFANTQDWVLPIHDPETTHPQTLQDEIERLKVLKSYLIVDSQREEAFERITQLASRIFDVTVSSVTLVDLGRQFFMSNHGFESFGKRDERDLPRNLSFCAHTIMSKSNVFVVKDLTKDFRFVDHPFVSGSPFAKFYAGAPLVTPEGYNIGTLCILDTVSRPNGLSEDECTTLADLAKMTMNVLVSRRYQLNQKMENSTQLLSHAAHDMKTPLTSIRLSLSILESDATIRRSFGEQQVEVLHTAASCTELLLQICTNTLDLLSQTDKKSARITPTTNLQVTSRTKAQSVVLTNMKDLVNRLQMIVDPIPKKVPCIVTLDKSVPTVVVADDIKLFRCAVNLITNAIDRTTTGKVQLTIRWDGNTLLLFECEDCGPDIPVEEYQNLFHGEHDDSKIPVGLLSLSLLIDSLDGEYGVRPRDIDSDGKIVVDSAGRRQSGCTFWFSIPLILPEMLDDTATAQKSPTVTNARAEPTSWALSSDNNVSLPDLAIQHRNMELAIAPPIANDEDYQESFGFFDLKRNSSSIDLAGSSDDAISNFLSSLGPSSEADQNIMDEIDNLDMDFNAPISDFEPYPVDNDNDSNTSDTKRH